MVGAADSVLIYSLQRGNIVLFTKFPLKYETHLCDGQSAGPSGVCCGEGPLYGRLSCDEVWIMVCEKACGLQWHRGWKQFYGSANHLALGL